MLWEFRFPEKQELKLRLKDMLEEQVDEKYYLSGKMLKYITADNDKWTGNNDKSLINKTIASTINTGEGQRRCDASNYVSSDVGENYDIKIKQVGLLDIKGQDCIKRVYSDDGLSPTLTDMQGGNRQPKIMIKNNTKQGYLEAYEGDGVYTNVSTKRGTVSPQISHTLTSFQDSGVVEKGLRIRKLTPKECWRLMRI